MLDFFLLLSYFLHGKSYENLESPIYEQRQLASKQLKMSGYTSWPILLYTEKFGQPEARHRVQSILTSKYDKISLPTYEYELICCLYLISNPYHYALSDSERVWLVEGTSFVQNGEFWLPNRLDKCLNVAYTLGIYDGTKDELVGSGWYADKMNKEETSAFIEFMRYRYHKKPLSFDSRKEKFKK